MILSLIFACTIDNNVEKIPETQTTFPRLVVTPNAVDFGITDAPLQEVVTLSNEGDAALEINNVNVEGLAFTITQTLGEDLLAPGEETDLIIQYDPLNMEDEGWLKINSNDPTDEITLVPLYGATSAPLLILDPPILDMGWVMPGTTVTDGFTVRNEGTADLYIESELLVGAEFTLTDPLPLPMTLAPGEETWVNIEYTPPDFGEHTGTLWLESNTFSGSTQGQIIGESLERPTAVCSVNPETVAPLYETATWIGEDSFSPSGAITEYEWTLIEKPTASSSYIPNGGANRPYFAPDLAGTYIAQLVVYDDSGSASEPCIATLEAVPAQTLWVELAWEHSGDDMDLHLLRPGAGLETNGDCYYANCVGWPLDWGVIGDPIDDPSLDLDDIPGTGPENINIYEPESGIFEVYVHDYPGSVFQASNDVTVRIYLSGELAWEGTKTISGENTYTRFAQVSWPDGTITPD